MYNYYVLLEIKDLYIVIIAGQYIMAMSSHKTIYLLTLS